MSRHLASHTALLLCNGEPPGQRTLRRLARASQLVVAADGGANSALALGVHPDVIIGDLDSLRPSTLRAFRHATVIRVRRQDNTDMEKALDFLQGEGIRRVFLTGATGRRIDMTLANLTVLWRYAPSMDVTVVGDGWYALPLRGRRRMHAPVGTTVSVLPCCVCRGVTLRGLRYPMVNGTLGVGAVAVSNVVRSSRFSIAIRQGRALVVVLEDVVPENV